MSRGGTLRTVPSPPTDRVLLLRLAEPSGPRWLGALEDGTVFERDPAAGWRLIAGPGDPDDSYDLMVAVVGASERRGGRLAGGPLDFGFDHRMCDEIRGGRFDGSMEAMLMTGFQMVERTTTTRPW